MIMPEAPAKAAKSPEDTSLQNAVVTRLEEVKSVGVTISPGGDTVWALYQGLGVKARSPSYTLDQFAAFLESMETRGLIKSEKLYRTPGPLMV